jgi:hypothetical protein
VDIREKISLAEINVTVFLLDIKIRAGKITVLWDRPEHQEVLQGLRTRSSLSRSVFKFLLQ